AVHGPQQSILEHQSQCADGESADRHLPVRLEPLQELAGPRLVGRAAHHARDPLPEYRGALPVGGTGTHEQPPMNGSLAQTATATAPRAKFEVRHLDFFYGRAQALKDINLTLNDRSITAFIGPSGCGKSTLLRVFNRMYALYAGHRASGNVLLDGQDILAPTVDIAMLRFRVGMVFQKATPFPMSIFDNVAFGL